MMTYGSICSGIEAATVAWHPLGWKPSFFAEIDKFPSAVLAHHYPEVSNLGDFTKITPDQHAPIDLLVGGTPCQSFSIAGLRGGLGDDRGNLALEYLRLADRARPRWLVWENVPGVLSSGGGRDFGSILGGMGELGYGVAYRVLDAQYIRVDGFWRAVPQRRRRVFAVGYLGDWRRAGAVLFERACLLGNSPPRRKTGQGTTYDAAPCLAASGRGFERAGDTRGQDCLVAGTLMNSGKAAGSATQQDAENGMLVPAISPALKARDYKGQSSDGDGDGSPLVAHALRADGFDAGEDGTGRGTPLVPVHAGAICKDSFTGGAGGRPEGAAAGHFLPIAFDCKASGRNGFGVGDVAPTLRAMGHSDSHQNAGGQIAMQSGWAVRRLTPRECERLQGFPDGYTDVPWRKKNWTPDGPRYKALGNSMAVNAMRWIGIRIAMVEGLPCS